MKKSKLLFGVVLAVCAAVVARAAETPPGAAACSGCHSANPQATGLLPSVAGRDADDVTAAMLQFKSGARPATVMDRIAKGFSEDEIRAIAAWLAAQK
jgi:cytochrome subunit of sulfide dehydrogenase